MHQNGRVERAPELPVTEVYCLVNKVGDSWSLQSRLREDTAESLGSESNVIGLLRPNSGDQYPGQFLSHGRAELLGFWVRIGEGLVSIACSRVIGAACGHGSQDVTHPVQ